MVETYRRQGEEVKGGGGRWGGHKAVCAGRQADAGRQQASVCSVCLSPARRAAAVFEAAAKEGMRGRARAAARVE